MKYIELTQGQRAIVDDADFGFLSQWSWYVLMAKGKKYAVRGEYNAKKKNMKTLYMHKFIMGLPKKGVVDHADGNSLDNRRQNLRIVSKQFDCFNRAPQRNCTSKYRGVGWDKRWKKWWANITYCNKNHILIFFG